MQPTDHVWRLLLWLDPSGWIQSLAPTPTQTGTTGLAVSFAFCTQHHKLEAPDPNPPRGPQDIIESGSSKAAFERAELIQTETRSHVWKKAFEYKG